MNDWLHNLTIVWMALLVFGLTALGTTAIYVVVMALSVGERARSFKAVSPGLLYRRWASYSLFLPHSPPRKFGATTTRPIQSLIERLAH
jgi:hypothetical protein